MNNNKALAVGGTIKLFDCEWQIEGIHLGSLGQESLYQLKSLTHKPGWTGQWEYHPMVFVPEPFIRQALTPQSSADLGRVKALLEAYRGDRIHPKVNEALRILDEVIGRE